MVALSTPPPRAKLTHCLPDELSTNTIASKLSAKTGPDLAIAASAHLALVKGQDKFTRKELHEQMQGATTFFKGTYSNNFTKYLNTLVKAKRLNLISKDTYSLSAPERQTLEERLAQQ